MLPTCGANASADATRPGCVRDAIAAAVAVDFAVAVAVAGTDTGASVRGTKLKAG